MCDTSGISSCVAALDLRVRLAFREEKSPLGTDFSSCHSLCSVTGNQLSSMIVRISFKSSLRENAGTSVTQACKSSVFYQAY